MPKSKKGGKDKKDKKKAEASSEQSGPGSDPAVLFRNYAKCCECVGIAIDENVKKALTQSSENPNLATQLIVLGPPPPPRRQINPAEDDPASSSSSAGENDDGDESSSSSSPPPSSSCAPIPLLGPGGCRALVSAILGECTEVPGIVKYVAFRDMRIWRSNIGDNGATAFARLLSKCDGKDENPKLEYLELPDNEIGVMGALALGRSLCCGMNKTLLSLNLDYNTGLKTAGIEALSRGLSMNSVLKNLSLRFCGIDDASGSSISNILSFSKSSLVSLNLEGNLLGGVGIANACCPALATNSTLQIINLADNNLVPDDDSITALESFGNVLADNKALTEVNLLRNVIGTDGGVALLKGLERNNTITSFKVDTTLCSEMYNALSRLPAGSGKKKKGGGKKKKKKKK